MDNVGGQFGCEDSGKHEVNTRGKGRSRGPGKGWQIRQDRQGYWCTTCFGTADGETAGFPGLPGHCAVIVKADPKPNHSCWFLLLGSTNFNSSEENVASTHHLSICPSFHHPLLHCGAVLALFRILPQLWCHISKVACWPGIWGCAGSATRLLEREPTSLSCLRTQSPLTLWYYHSSCHLLSLPHMASCFLLPALLLASGKLFSLK